MKALQSHLLIFDLDGTLVDSAGDICFAVNDLLASIDCAPLSLEEVRGMIGEGAMRLVEKVLTARPTSRITPESGYERFLEIYESAPTTYTTPYPGVREVLDQFAKAGAQLAVCTNKPGVATNNVLRDLDLSRYFSVVIAGDSLAVRKPDAAMIDAVISQIGAEIASVILIGDSEIDSQTAAAANIPFVLMTYGYRRGPADAIPATYRLDHFADLTALPPLRAGLL